MIHNHEVPSSILGPATKKAVRIFILIAFFLCFFFVGTEKSRIFAPMKQIISTIFFCVFVITASAQDVVRMVEPAYADDGAVYRQSVYVPQKWDKRRVVLYLERPLGATTVLVNGKEAGGDTLVNLPQQLDVTKHIMAGQRNTIEVRVAGHDAHGVMGSIELRSQPRRLYISKLTTKPRPFMKLVTLGLEIQGQSPDFSFFGVQTMIQREGVDTAKIYVNEWDITANRMSFETPVFDDDCLWDEFHPILYRVGVTVGVDYQERIFGMREAGVVDGRLFINRHPVYLRGCMMDNYFPMGGRMPMDVQTWTHIFQRLSDLGLNHVRFRGYCPPEAAFAAADKVGMYLQPEAQSTIELNRITEAYGHHPSLVLISLGSECYVYNNDVTTPVQLRQPVISGSDMMAYKQGVERALLGGNMHYLLEGICDRKGDFSGVLHERWDEKDNAFTRQFTQFCRSIVPLVQLPKTEFAPGDTLRAPVYVYNAMYGNLHGVRTSFYLSNDSNKVMAGGQVANGDVSLDSLKQIGELVLPMDSVAHRGGAWLTVVVGSTAIRNRWRIEIKE